MRQPTRRQLLGTDVQDDLGHPPISAVNPGDRCITFDESGREGCDHVPWPSLASRRTMEKQDASWTCRG